MTPNRGGDHHQRDGSKHHDRIGHRSPHRHAERRYQGQGPEECLDQHELVPTLLVQKQLCGIE